MNKTRNDNNSEYDNIHTVESEGLIFKHDEKLNQNNNNKKNNNNNNNDLKDRRLSFRKKLLEAKEATKPIEMVKRDVYIELEELNYSEHELFYNSINDSFSNYQWRVVARWIKFEQNIDPQTNIWNKPFVGAILYHNLVYLKSKLQYGTIILNSRQETLENVMDEIIQDFISRGNMAGTHRERLKAIILSQHRNHVTRTNALSIKKAPISDLYSSDWKYPRLNSNQSFLIDNNNNIDGSFYRKLSQHHSKNASSHKSQDNLNLTEVNLEKTKLKDVRIPIISDSNENFHHNTNTTNNKSFKQTFSRRNSFFNHHKFSRTDENGNEVEAFLIMVGAVEFLDRPVVAFVRLSNDQFIDHLIEFQIKTRFLFIFLGPPSLSVDYVEIGRCMGTLMTNKSFHDIAYKAKNRQEIIRGITNFSNRSLCFVLPDGNYDEDLLMPIIEWVKKKMKNKPGVKGAIEEFMKENHGNNNKIEKLKIMDKKLNENELETDKKKKVEKFDPFKRTGYPFGSLIQEAKHRYSNYAKDIKDGLNLHCVVAFVFIFTVCIAPALCFGGILADKTDRWLGVNEMLIATSLNGLIFGLFSGQPIMIFGATGPFLLFEEMLYNFCRNTFCVEFLATRVWVSIWVLVFTLIMLASEGVFIIHSVTRFSEEIFAFLIACVFLADVVKKTLYYFKKDPISSGDAYCYDYPNVTDGFEFNSSNVYNFTNRTIYLNDKCGRRYDSIDMDNPYRPQPNIAFISVILIVGTCTMALLLKKLRRSNFFGSYMRRTLSDVGQLVSIMLMIIVDYLIRKHTNINTQKLDIPESLSPTNHVRKGWFVSPFGNNYEEYSEFTIWMPVLSIFPAILVFIVLFFEVELTSIMLSTPNRKLKKGTGFNLDLLLAASMMTLNSFFGLPWLCSAPVRTLTHWASLTVYSKTFIPGEKPKLINVMEQRITAITVHLAIGICLKARYFLKIIPVPVLFGIFFYFGIVSLSGTQLFERIKLIFIPFKYCPNVPYSIGIRPSKRNMFTLIQITGVVILMTFKSYIDISFMFPIALLLLVPFRKFIMPKIFTQRELEQLDDETETNDEDLIHDFYELTHLPI